MASSNPENAISTLDSKSNWHLSCLILDKTNGKKNHSSCIKIKLFCRGVGRYEIVEGHILNHSLKIGGALCYQTTKKWWGTCPKAPPMVTPLILDDVKK